MYQSIFQAYIRGFHYPKYMFLTYGWYASKWWEIAGDSSKYNCTAEERASVLTYTLGPLIPEIPTGVDTVAEPNIVSYCRYLGIY